MKDLAMVVPPRILLSFLVRRTGVAGVLKDVEEFWSSNRLLVTILPQSAQCSMTSIDFGEFYPGLSG